jgi:membrane protease YdiL (CAAX protease family)
VISQFGSSWLRLKPRNPATPLDARERRALWIEITLVLLISFGASALSSILSLVESLLAPLPLSEQTTTLNPSRGRLGLIDLLRQLITVARLCAYAGIAAYLLQRSGFSFKKIGLGWTRLDALSGVGLAALIGIPGLGLYLVAHALGLSLTVEASGLDENWWRAPALLLWACANSLAEEVVVVAYLITRLRQLGWGENGAMWASALLRGCYHTYQGFGAALGNVVMGVVFARWWQKTDRLWPLIVAHALIDAVAFVGYALLKPLVGWIP